ncbi:MAG TPA: hypothetical protein PJ991_11050 [Kiritimatiellia bacterium]|nr:hypothetical protein [Kiritimatiellia bacterium]
MSDNHLQENDYTDRDIRVKPLVIFLVATLVVTAVTIMGIRVLFVKYSSGFEVVPEAIAAQIAGRPDTAVVEGLGEAAESLKRLRAAESARLNHYRWADESAGLVQIPISDAMELLVKKGLPTRESSGGN